MRWSISIRLFFEIKAKLFTYQFGNHYDIFELSFKTGSRKDMAYLIGREYKSFSRIIMTHKFLFYLVATA